MCMASYLGLNVNSEMYLPWIIIINLQKKIYSLLHRSPRASQVYLLEKKVCG